MQNISQQLQESFEIVNGTCKRERCDSVHCYGAFGDFSIALHCSEPLGFEMKEKNETNTISHLFTKSEMWNGLNVTVVNVRNKALGLAIYFNGYPHPLVQYTEVPIDSSACTGKYLHILANLMYTV